MKNLKVKIIALLILLGVVLSGLPLLVYGSANPRITIANVESAESTRIKNAIKDVNSEIKSDIEVSWDFLGYSTDSNNFTVEINIAEYKKLSQAHRQDVMTIALNTISGSNISSTNRTKIYNFIAESDSSTSSLVRQLKSDVDADFVSAYSMFKPFSGVYGTILGVFALAIFALLGATVVTDLCYLTLPVITDYLNTHNDNQKPKFVSVEAWQSMKTVEAQGGATSKSLLGAYLKLKGKTFIALFIILLYLVSGELYGFLASLIDYFRGLIG